MTLPRPNAVDGATVWTVQGDGTRALVRVSDGTGFAVGIDMLHLIWAAQDRPAVISTGVALPSEMAPATAAPGLKPNTTEMKFDMRRDRSASGVTWLRGFRLAGIVLAIGLVSHLAIAVADAVAMDRIATRERAAAQVQLAQVLPGVDLASIDTVAILSRLAPALVTTRRSGFLPLLAGVSSVLSATGDPVSFRRLGYVDGDGTLTLLIQAAALDDLQRLQQELEQGGFDVSAGAATASDGGAEVEMRISGGQSQ
jgi:hypothetical protein